MSQPTCILVLAVPRSGSSCVAGILHHLGIDMGDHHRFGADEMNAAGYFVDVGFQEIFDDIPLVPEPAAITGAHRDKVRARVAARSASGMPWGAKFSHAALVADLFPGAKIIATQRPLGQSKASWAAWGGDPEDLDRAVVAMARALAGAGRRGTATMIVDYDELLAEPNRVVERVARFVDRPPTRAASEFVRPALRRFA